MSKFPSKPADGVEIINGPVDIYRDNPIYDREPMVHYTLTEIRRVMKMHNDQHADAATEIARLKAALVAAADAMWSSPIQHDYGPEEDCTECRRIIAARDAARKAAE